MSTRDYTDSDGDSDGGDHAERMLLRDDSAPLSTPGGSPSRDDDADDGGIRITLRPTLGHLARSNNGEASSPGVDRSSASPPPPIRLKLGMKHARAHPVYSDSEESEGGATATPVPKAKAKPRSKGKSKPTTAKDKAKEKKDKEKEKEKDMEMDMENELDPEEVDELDDDDDDKHALRSPPAKKQRTLKAKPRSSGSNAGPTLPAQHRKQYDWLQPSSASASHHGPPERIASHPASSVADADEMRPSGDESAQDSVPPPTDRERGGGSNTPVGSEKKKRRRGGADSTPGPGKNWRKGMKKGDPIPWKDGATFLGDAKMRGSPLGTPVRASMSRDVSPEPPLDAVLLATAVSRAEKERGPSPPFVLADPQEMGIPVFSKPIVPPKIVLGTFPRVTSFFAPMDNKPFRKEAVRTWSKDERTIAGVGGGMLKFKTWRQGPQSELGLVLQAQKEADQAAAKAKKALKEAAAAAAAANGGTGTGTPGSATPGNKDGSSNTPHEGTPERPLFAHSMSSDSVPPAAPSSVAGDDGGDEASEMGDDNESVAGSVAPSTAAAARDTPVPSMPAPPRIHAGRGAAGGKRGRPRKSKLAQEIIPTDDDTAPASHEASAEPEAGAVGEDSKSAVAA